MNRYRSLWLPGLLILVGAIALAANAGLVEWGSIYRLFDLWPLVLILVGAELILRATSSPRLASTAGLVMIGVAVVGAVAYVAASPPLPTGGNFDSSGKVGEFQKASFHIAGGASDLKVHSEDLGDTLYRAHVVYTGERPGVSLEGADLFINGPGFNFIQWLFGPHGKNSVDLTVNSKLPWSVEVSGGASHAVVDLSGVQVTGVDVSGGANSLTLDLGRPSGTVNVDVSGGASSVTIRRPSGVPVDVSLSGGANSVDLDGQRLGGFGDQEAKSSGYDSATDRYAVDVSGGASSIKVVIAG